MLSELIPSFDAYTVFIEPWVRSTSNSAQIVLMGFFVTAACGLVGCFVILRRMALVGDAISHSLLPGIAIAFIVSQSRDTVPMMIGAVIAGVVTVVLIEAIRNSSRIKADAAIGIVFSSLFAIGVVFISVFADQVDLDVDCVLYGEIGTIPQEDPAVIAGIDFGPIPLIRMAIIAVVVLLLLILFYKELLVTTFDAGLAASLGIRPKTFQYGLTIILSIVIVSSFESVGVVLVIAMLIFPGATAMLLTDQLPRALSLSILFSAICSLLGFHFATWLNSSTAGGMAVIAGLLFTLAWLFSPSRGLIGKLRRHRTLATQETLEPNRSAIGD